MKLARVLWATFAFVASTHALADTASDARAYVEKALQTYVASGPRALMETITKDGPLEGNPQALTQANGLQQIQDISGKPAAYEVVSGTKLSERTVQFLFVVHLEKAELFGNMLVYKTIAGPLTAVNFSVNIQSDKVWPSWRVYGSP